MPSAYIAYPNLKSSTHIQDFLSGRSVIANTDPAIVGGLDAISAFARVAWLSRGVKILAGEVARFPHTIERNGQDVSDADEFAEFRKRESDLLYMAEASASLTGAGYWLLEANQYGFNLTPRWVLSQSMKPVVDREKGLTGFKRNNKPIPLEEVVYFWEPSFTSEIAPGVGAAQTALSAASQLYAMDAFVAQFFNQGAVKVTVFPVPPGTPEQEVEKFQSFLKRRMSGVRNAFQNVVMRLTDKLTPIVIGSDVKDTQAAELIRIQRDNVAVALGMSPSILDGTSANFATAQSDRYGFFTGTVIPRVEWLYEKANAQYFERLDAKIVAHPEQLEIMQSAQLEQAQAVTALVPGEQVITVDEARQYIGLGPMPKQAKPEPPPAPIIVNSPPPQAPEMTPEAIAATMGKWRRTHLDAVAGGVYYSALPFKASLPAALYETVAGELGRVTGAREVREVFERHWPNGKKLPLAEWGEESALLDLAVAVREATRIMEAK